jgi:hypothetical protein
LLTHLFDLLVRLREALELIIAEVLLGLVTAGEWRRLLWLGLAHRQARHPDDGHDYDRLPFLHKDSSIKLDQ